MMKINALRKLFVAIAILTSGQGLASGVSSESYVEDPEGNRFAFVIDGYNGVSTISKSTFEFQFAYWNKEDSAIEYEPNIRFITQKAYVNGNGTLIASGKDTTGARYQVSLQFPMLGIEQFDFARPHWLKLEKIGFLGRSEVIVESNNMKPTDELEPWFDKTRYIASCKDTRIRISEDFNQVIIYNKFLSEDARELNVLEKSFETDESTYLKITLKGTDMGETVSRTLTFSPNQYNLYYLDQIDEVTCNGDSANRWDWGDWIEKFGIQS